METGHYDDVICFVTPTDKCLLARTAALWACWLARSSLLDRLLKLGVDPNSCDDAGRYDIPEVTLVRINCRID